MAIVTPQQYYEDESAYGNYQYVTAKSILDAMLVMAEDDDSNIKNVKRSTMLLHLKHAIADTHKKAGREKKAYEITVPDSLTFPLPQDYYDYVRFSVVVVDGFSGSRRLELIDINKNMNAATGYLQDSSGALLFDSDGYILTADSSNGYAFPYKTFSYIESGGQSHLDTSKLAEYGEVFVDKRRGTILFSSELMDKEIVMEYISDGLEANITESQIMVNKMLVQCIKNWVYYACIEQKKNVSQSEKDRALKRYKTTLHEAQFEMADFSFSQFARIMRTNTMAM